MGLPAGYVNARWHGVESTLYDGTPLIPGETVVAIPKGEAQDSDFWHIVSGKAGRDEEKADAVAEKGGDS